MPENNDDGSTTVELASGVTARVIPLTLERMQAVMRDLSAAERRPRQVEPGATLFIDGRPVDSASLVVTQLEPSRRVSMYGGPVRWNPPSETEVEITFDPNTPGGQVLRQAQRSGRPVHVTTDRDGHSILMHVREIAWDGHTASAQLHGETRAVETPPHLRERMRGHRQGPQVTFMGNPGGPNTWTEYGRLFDGDFPPYEISGVFDPSPRLEWIDEETVLRADTPPPTLPADGDDAAPPATNDERIRFHSRRIVRNMEADLAAVRPRLRATAERFGEAMSDAAIAMGQAALSFGVLDGSRPSTYIASTVTGNPTGSDEMPTTTRRNRATNASTTAPALASNYRPRQASVAVELIDRQEQYQPSATQLESFRAHGILQSPALIRLANGRYRIAAGRRRINGAHLLGIGHVPALVFPENTPDSVAAEIALAENYARSNNPVCELEALQELVAAGVDLRDAAARVGVPFAVARRRMYALRMPEGLVEHFRAGRMTASTAERIGNMPENMQEELLRMLDTGVVDSLNRSTVDSVRARLTGTVPAAVARQVVQAAEQGPATPRTSRTVAVPQLVAEVEQVVVDPETEAEVRTRIRTVAGEGVEGWPQFLAALQVAEDCIPASPDDDTDEIAQLIHEMRTLAQRLVAA